MSEIRQMTVGRRSMKHARLSHFKHLVFERRCHSIVVEFGVLGLGVLNELEERTEGAKNSVMYSAPEWIWVGKF